MKLLNHKVARTLAAAAVATCAVAMLSVGAFAADVAIGEKDPTYGGYGAPAGPAIQGNIMLISADGDVAIGEKDPTYGGYGAPEGPAIQGNIMLIGADGAESDTLKLNYSVKGLFGRQVLYTARQNGTVLTLDVPASVATFRCTMEDLTTMMNNGINTLVFKTEKTSTTLNLSLLTEGYDADAKVKRLLGRADLDFLSVDEDLAVIRVINAREHVHERGLAAAVFPQKRKDFALAQGKADVVVCNDLAKRFFDVAHLDCLLDLFHALASRSGYGWARLPCVRIHILKSSVPLLRM